MRILYDSKSLEYKEPFGALCTSERCRISLWIPASCKTRRARICFQRENGEPHASFFLKKEREEAGYEIHTAVFSLAEADLYFYYFHIDTENESFPLYKEGWGDTNMCRGELWQLTVYPDCYRLPEGFAGGVMYQIFPDRFHRAGEGDLSGKMAPFRLHSDLREIPEYLPDESGEVTNCDFFGGNLRGIGEKLDYLRALGVTLIYLNPIFKAWSNHRYDTADYKKIDEMLGTEEDFSALCHEAHRRGMKVILDGVFSHVGSRSRYFDVRSEFGTGAVSNSDSPYRDWFDFQNYPNEYTSWWGIRTLPCVNEMHPGFLDHIIRGEDSVCARWLRLGADGWRLDVADELPEEFIGLFRERMKKEKPDSFLLGEVWEDASNKISYGKRRHYFSHGELDSVMNYPWREAILNFVSGKDEGEGFRSSVMTLAEHYPPSVLPLLMNFLSTHDTPRVLSLLGGRRPESKEERARFSLSPEERKKAEEKLRLAAFLQYFLPGIPSIYYGDEIGTEGFEDPFCRKYFDWEKESELPSFFAYLARLRRHPALLEEGIRVEVLEQGVLELTRWGKTASVTSFVNASSHPVTLFKKGTVILGCNASEEAEKIQILPYGFAVMENA